MKKIEQENSKERILATATKLFGQKGYSAVSIREICKKANVNICMISYYWGGKQELYNAIVEELVSMHTRYAETFMDFSKEPEALSRNEQVDLLMLMLDKFIDFFYANITNDLLIFLIKEQQASDFKAIIPPAVSYLRKLLACILNKKENDKEIIYKTLFILAQINSPRILPVLSLRPLGQDEFTQEDISIVKNNVKFYVNAILKEVKID
ncbi:probable transcriptional regulator protein TetR family [Brachyspira sp. CAG:484]|nr:probable transcriptional regulator protein TetR family [Brachyspira sp. CAG:484]